MSVEDLITACRFVEVDEHFVAGEAMRHFSCGEADLDDFFRNDVALNTEKMVGRTYAFVREEDGVIVSIFTIATDSINVSVLPNNRRRKIKEMVEKPLRRYPGILIGRLGVNKDLEGLGYGTAIMEYIKLWLMDSVPVGFRFLIVDAYNNPKTLHFYEKNQFYYVFSTEQQEIESSGIATCPTRLMIYDFRSA